MASMTPENVAIHSSDLGSAVTSLTQATQNAFQPPSAYGVDTSASPYSQSSISSFDEANNTTVYSVTGKEPSPHRPSSGMVRFIAIGVLAVLVAVVLLSMLFRRMCRRGRRRRLTIKLVRKHSDSSLHREETASSFFVGDKSSEDVSKSSRTAGERTLSCAYSGGLAGIGINKQGSYRSQIPPLQRNDENDTKLNFDNPYGTPTSMFGRSITISPSYVAHLPKKRLKLLELPPLADNPNTAEYHGHSISTPTAKNPETIEAVFRAPKKPHVSPWLKNDPVAGAVPSINITSSSLTPHSHLVDSLVDSHNSKPAVKSKARQLDSRQNKGVRDHDQNLPPKVISYRNVGCENKAEITGNAIHDAKRNNRMTFLGEPLVSVQNLGKDDTLCIYPVTMPLKVFTNVDRERARGIAF